MKHDKRFEKLDELDDYELVHKKHDIRGRPLVGKDGEKFGTIKALLVGKDKDRVVAIRLEDGRTCAVEPLEIHDNAVIYGDAATTHANEHTDANTDAHAKHDSAAHDNASGDVVEEDVIPVVEEKVTIGKRVSDHGRDINVRSRVVSDTVDEDVALRNESVDVEKHAVNEHISKADADALLKQGDAEVSMTERHEEVVVDKDAVKTDEVVVKKTADDKVKHVTEEVRKTEVDVDDTKKRK
jgi:stress response protein YsnF